MSPISSDLPVLIIGAGVVGLTLAQSLKKDGIPFQIFERDTHVDSRAHGWGITVHWALDALKACLPPHVISRLETAQVDPEQGRKDTGQFLLLDLSNAKPRYVIPPAPRLRLNRRLFREVLLENIDVQWGKSIESFREVEHYIEVTFRDGTIMKGSMLVGADGASSRTRHILCPNTADLDQLPVRMVGVTVRLMREKIEPLRAIDPLLFQGCHPDTGNYFWFSVLSTPEVNGSLGGEEFYEGQVMLSWKVKGDDDEVPASSKERLAKMKSRALPFETRLRTVIEEIPEDTEVIEIKIKDWPNVQWPNHGGKTTLIGDAAHAMTMCMSILSYR
jgi:2-polyprenyl-6-methoxyphenol hydroxylase-like FAD-dependent oxidoreductase